MSKVLAHTPSWLSRPSPGFDFFQPVPNAKAPSALSNGSGKKLDYAGPSRIIAHRDTEVFYAVGNEIRWTDLVLLKDAGESQEQKCRQSLGRSRGVSRQNGNGESGIEDEDLYYRVLKTPVAGQIRQLVVSPSMEYMAILTSHTVHVAILPDVSHLSPPQDTTPLRLKTFQLGPTAHVLEQAPVVSALWHPLGASDCLVTVTTDACVRLWELDRNSRHSFDEPALAVDLRKLANAQTSGDDLRASKYGTSKGFSPDSVEMEVASACFGGLGRSDEHGWAPMTLWIAMTEGDVYALCPLMPTKWRPTPTTLPSLTTSVVSRASIIESDSSVSEDEKRITEQQQKWLADIDNQDPIYLDEFATNEVYKRPSSPPAIPKLQGPMRLTPEPDFGQVTDILVVAAKVDDEALMLDEDEIAESESEGLSVNVVCLATDAGNVHVCLDLDGVEAQWLPSKKQLLSKRRFVSEEEPSELLIVETIVVEPSADRSTTVWPIFSHGMDIRNPYFDSASRYTFFLTLSTGVYSLSLSPWIASLEDELSGPTDSGAGFRMEVLFDTEKSQLEQVIAFDAEYAGTNTTTPAACVALVDSDLGYFVLSSTSNLPQAATLEIPSNTSIYTDFAPDVGALPAAESRQPYHAAEAFFASSALPSLLATTSLKRSDLTSQVRFSPTTLQILTEAHRILSGETNKLGLAAADLFRRCERMQEELREQVRKVEEIANKIDAVTGAEDEELEDGDHVYAREKVDQRISAVNTHNEALQKRVEDLRRRLAGLGGKEMSVREEAWMREVDGLSSTLGKGEGEQSEEAAALTGRFQAAKNLKQELLKEAQSVPDSETEGQDDEDSLRGSTSSRVPADFRKQKIAQVMQLLERETALIDAVTERLRKLGGLQE